MPRILVMLAEIVLLVALCDVAWKAIAWNGFCHYSGSWQYAIDSTRNFHGVAVAVRLHHQETVRGVQCGMLGSLVTLTIIALSTWRCFSKRDRVMLLFAWMGALASLVIPFSYWPQRLNTFF